MCIKSYIAHKTREEEQEEDEIKTHVDYILYTED